MVVESKQPDAFAITFVFLGIATLAVALRSASRLMLRQFHWDDTLVIIAWTISVAQAITAAIWMKITWYGYRTEDLPEFSVEDRVLADKVFFAQGLLYNPVLGLVKWSILLFLLRLDDQRRSINWTLWALLVFNLMHMVSVFLVVVFQCSPVHMYWDHHKTDEVVDGRVVNDRYSCIDQAPFSLGTAAIAVLTDIAILLVPIATMWNLNMPVRRKVAVVLVLSLGWVVAVVGVIRIKFFVDFWYGRFPDPSWSLWHTLSGVENNVAILVSCGPAIKAFLTRFFPTIFGSSAASRPTGNVYYTSGGYELNSRSGGNGSCVHRATDPLPDGHAFGKFESTEAIVRSENLDRNRDSVSEYVDGEQSRHQDTSR